MTFETIMQASCTRELALTPDDQGDLPLHRMVQDAALHDIREWLSVAPEAAMKPGARGDLPLHRVASHRAKND